MNFGEGMRRLALFIGALGAIAGCLASYVSLRDTLEKRARYNTFRSLAASDVVQQARKSLQEERESFFRPWVGPLDMYRVAPKDIATTWKLFIPERREELLAKMTAEQKHRLRAVIEQQSQESEKDPYADTAMLSSEVNKGGIKTIVWEKDYEVYSVETQDGAILYRTSPPNLWPSLLAVLFPGLGFAAPWASFRALAWVGAGFVEKPK
jgi:hypothetical protein